MGNKKQEIENPYQREDVLGAMLSSIGDHMSMMDKDLTILWANEIAREHFGDDIVGKKCYAVYHNRTEPCEPYPCITLKAFQDGQIHQHETKVLDKNGKELYFHCTANVSLRDKINGRPKAVIEISKDITQAKQMESQRLQLQKMEAIRTLASGIAHDFNNVLGIILGNTEMALNDLPSWDPSRSFLSEIKTTTLRAKGIVKRIRACAQNTDERGLSIHLNQVLQESVRVIQETIPAFINFRQDMDAPHDFVRADSVQIHQVLMNLCTNACDAMHETSGVLSIRLRNVVLDERVYENFHVKAPGIYIKLNIEDTGGGIEKDIADRVFDPYFSSWDFRKGSGLGLSEVRGILESLEGEIAFKSSPGKGTVFTILLPVAEADELPTPQEVPFVKGSEKILFVDDEIALARLGKQMLEHYGYTVTISIDPLKALELFRQHPDQFDMVITDLTMPNMTGDQMVAEMVKIKPDLPVIACSGYSDLIDSDITDQKGIKAFLAKPVRMVDLKNKVREVFDGK